MASVFFKSAAKVMAIGFLSLSFATVAQAKECKTGKPCGNSCISKDAVCSKDAPPAKNCKKGKPCGNSCIPKDSVCHK